MHFTHDVSYRRVKCNYSNEKNQTVIIGIYYEERVEHGVRRHSQQLSVRILDTVTCNGTHKLYFQGITTAGA